MDSLYSRYVPPKKKQKTDSAPPPSISAVEQTTSAAEYVTPTKSDASSTYKRYVPPPKSKRLSSSLANKPLTGETPSIQKTSKKKNEDVEEVKNQRTKGDAIKDGPAAIQSDPMDLDLPSTSEKKQKRKKKHALEPKIVEADGEVSEEDTRHASILARREKSLRKSEKLAKKAAKKAIEKNEEDMDEDVEMEEPIDIQPLGPLPQPELLPESTTKPTFSSLPPWLASPIKTSPNATASFSDLGIKANAISVLNSKGFDEAFAVQAAVLPLLLPGPRQRAGDVLVSAATGSGKTLAYVLPMIEDISKTTVNRLSGLIVMPTRELVSQAKEVCDICASAFSHNRKHIKTGIAMGSQSLKVEQAALMTQEHNYDPAGSQKQQDRSNAAWCVPGQEPREDLDEGICLMEEYTNELGDLCFVDEDSCTLQDPDEIGPRSKVNILICTPGRLVEHLKSTPGFTLEYLKWLVIDEADKLLNQSFQEWVETIMAHLPTRVTKIILSATMTRDVGQLSSLKLHRPKLVVLEGEKNEDGRAALDLDAEGDDGKTLALPATLHETAIKVDDEADKPLYLLELLRSQKMVDMDVEDVHDSSSEASSSDDDSDSDSDNTSSSGEESSDDESNSCSVTTKEKPSTRRSKPITKPRGVLIFTKSNENALRLSRLLTLINPILSRAVGTLTSTIPMSTRRKTLASFQSGKISVLVASDLVSRGLDLPSLAHVVNYDMPSSLSSYVHRVGRTARAGKEGHAWTLFTNTEARWFWNEIARSGEVNRDSGKVNRFKIEAKLFGDELRAKYEESLETLGQEARGQK